MGRELRWLVRFTALTFVLVLFLFLGASIKSWAKDCTTTLRCNGSANTFKCQEGTCVKNCKCSKDSTSCVTITFNDVCAGTFNTVIICCRRDPVLP